MTRTLAARPNLDHFRGQAKTLFSQLRAGDTAAARMFRDHLPTARGMPLARVRAAGFRLADAQSVVARSSGFAGWPALVRHVEELRALEGEWTLETLQIDGNDMPRAMIGGSALLLDGDRFRMQAPEGAYDGRFGIDTSTVPMRIDIEFVQGPEAGNWSYGLFERHGDRLTICLGLVGAPRPEAFASLPGTGHALERFRRASALRPAGVTGGVAQASRAPEADVLPASSDDFAIPMNPALRRLEGTWLPVRIVTNGEEMRADWLPYGSRTGAGNEARVVFGGQVMLHVKIRIDESVSPVAIDYLHLTGPDQGKVSRGILEWVGEELRILMAAPGHQRPVDFSAPGADQTLSHWRRSDKAS